MNIDRDELRKHLGKVFAFLDKASGEGLHFPERNLDAADIVVDLATFLDLELIDSADIGATLTDGVLDAVVARRSIDVEAAIATIRNRFPDWERTASMLGFARAVGNMIRRAREEVSGEEVKFAETVRDELKERARAYSHLSIERGHFDRAILAISGLLRAAMNPKPAEAASEAVTAANTSTDMLDRMQLLSDVELHLQSCRIFLTSREKMHECGVEIHDELQGRVTAAIEALATPATEKAVEEWPEKWSGDMTVGNMIANLRTISPETPMYSAYHISREGKPSLLRVRRPTISRERVDGLTIKSGDESVPYSTVVWSHPQEPDTAPPAADAPAMREALATCERAIAEYYRYFTGGETRGSYDGKPERQGLWDAQRKAKFALAAFPEEPSA